MRKATFILGAPDPEMAQIEAVLCDLDVPYVFATIKDGSGYRRIRASEAYGSAVQPGQSHVLYVPDQPGQVVYLVECEVDRERLVGPEVCRIDHHRQGDSGYGWPPGMYWGASSLGQVLQVPGVALAANLQDYPTREEMARYMMIAAADHCPAAAYQGACPGVDPEELRRWRLSSRAEFQRRPRHEVLRDVQEAENAILGAPTVAPYVADLRRAGSIPELPEASLRTGFAVLYRLDPRRGKMEEVLHLEAVDGVEPLAERALREIAAAGEWAEQRRRWYPYGESVSGEVGAGRRAVGRCMNSLEF